MKPSARRRRALVLVCLAVACGGLAASRVGDRIRDVEERVGRPLPVVVARTDVDADTRLSERAVRSRFAVREVPASFAPPDALTAPQEAVGLRTRVPLARGSYVTGAQLGVGDREERAAGAPRPGERAVEVAAAGGESVVAAGPGGRVDVLVTSERRADAGRTHLALEDVEVLAVRAGEPGQAGEEEGAAPSGGSVVATLRVTLRQAVFLTAAQSFAREVRLLPRPAGDTRRSSGAIASAGG